MKHYIIPALLLLVLNSCKTEEKNETKEQATDVDYVVLTGIIKNYQNDSIVISNNYNPSFKVLNISSEGAFQDTLFLNDTVNSYYFQHAEQYASLFLKNGYVLDVQVDYSDFDNSLSFKGHGADENSLMLEMLMMNSEDDIYALIEEEDDIIYQEKLTVYKNKINSLLEAKKDIDKDLILLQKDKLQGTFDELDYYRTSSIAEKKIFAALKGNPSPIFNQYETPQGDTKSLSDFLGKYIYIDIWATWCGPCLAETPYLKEIYNDYKDKGLSVLSISVDKQKSKDKWANMVHEEELVWNNLITDNDFSSEFIQAYSINSIPRFILLDPSGKVVSAGAPRPSSGELRPLLDSLLSQ